MQISRLTTKPHLLTTVTCPGVPVPALTVMVSPPEPVDETEELVDPLALPVGVVGGGGDGGGGCDGGFVG